MSPTDSNINKVAMVFYARHKAREHLLGGKHCNSVMWWNSWVFKECTSGKRFPTQILTCFMSTESWVFQSSRKNTTLFLITELIWQWSLNSTLIQLCTYGVHKQVGKKIGMLKNSRCSNCRHMPATIQLETQNLNNSAPLQSKLNILCINNK